MKARTLLIVAAGMLFFATGPASAAVIYDNDPPDLVDGIFSDPFIPFQAADDFFLLPGANTITDLHWWGGYDFTGNTPANPDDFTIRIFTDAEGVPDPLMFTTVFSGEAGRMATGDQVDGFDLYEYSTDIAPVTLDAGTTYWLSIVNDSVSNGGDPWYWATSDGVAGNAVRRASDGQLWDIPIDHELAFNLTGPIPEPSGVLLFSVGMLVVGSALRRRAA